MRAIPWIIAGVGIGLTAYFVLNQPPTQYATGNDDIEDAAANTANWGSRQRIKGTGGRLVGKAKESVGRFVGDPGLEGEGVLDQAVGGLRDTAGQAAHVVADTIHELNH